MTESASRWPSLLVAAGAGLLLISAFPPFGWFPMAILAPVLLLAGVKRSANVVDAAAAGLVFGAVFMGGLMWWLMNLRWEALAAVLVVEVPFFVVFTVVVYAGRHADGWSWIALVSGAWAATEFARARIPVGGLEWGGLGYPAGELVWLRDITQWVGTSGWGVIFIMVAASLVHQFSWRRLAAITSPVLVLIAVAAASHVGPAGDELRVAIVQGNSPCPEHCLGERAAIFDSHLELTQQLQPGAVDLVVWAESATTFDPRISNRQGEAISAEAVRLGAIILVGGDRPDTDATFVNSNVVFDGQGDLVSEIRKIHPVPFGEYIPLRPLFGRLSITALVPRDMVRGEGSVVADVDGTAVGSVISFEGSFARYTRSSVNAGAQVLVLASNEASYGVSPASDQLIGMTRMRAAELGVDVVHAAITGSSTLVTDGGYVGEVSALYEESVITGSVRIRDGSPTLYAQWGDWVAVAAMATGAMVAMWLSITAAARRPLASMPSEE